MYGYIQMLRLKSAYMRVLLSNSDYILSHVHIEKEKKVQKKSEKAEIEKGQLRATMGKG